jgi:hypothetical protein
MQHYLYALGAILCWASLPAATGSGLQGLGIEALLFYSFTAAALFLYLLDVVQKRTLKLTLPGLRASLVGVWGIFVYHYLYYQRRWPRRPFSPPPGRSGSWSFPRCSSSAGCGRGSWSPPWSDCSAPAW